MTAFEPFGGHSAPGKDWNSTRLRTPVQLGQMCICPKCGGFLGVARKPDTSSSRSTTSFPATSDSRSSLVKGTRVSLQNMRNDPKTEQFRSLLDRLSGICASTGMSSAELLTLLRRDHYITIQVTISTSPSPNSTDKASNSSPKKTTETTD